MAGPGGAVSGAGQTAHMQRLGRHSIAALGLALAFTAIVTGCGSSAGQGSSRTPIGSARMAPIGSASPPPATAAPYTSASGAATGERLPGEPDPRLTPGAVNPAVTQATIHQTICVSGWTATVRPPASYTTELKREQIAAYGYADTSLTAYEEDHLVPLEVGGAPADPSNLWPEPYAATLADGTPVGARVKDHLENDLHDKVCAGTLSLRDAQADFLDGWVHAWLAEGH